MARLIGGPMDGSVIAMDDHEMEFFYTCLEYIGPASPAGFEEADLVRHAYRRTAPGADLVWSEDG